MRLAGIRDPFDLDLTFRRIDPSEKKPRFLGASSDEEEDESGDSDESEPCAAAREDLDEDLGDDFLVEDDEDEDEDGAAIVAEYREQITMQAQGAKYYVKACSLRLHCFATEANTPSNLDFPSVDYSPQCASSSFLSTERAIAHILSFFTLKVICPKVNWLGDPAFQQAYEYVQRDLTGLINSLIGSSAWVKKFRRAVDCLPNFQLEDAEHDALGAPCGASSFLVSALEALRG